MDDREKKEAMAASKKDPTITDGEISVSTVKEGFKEVVPEHLEDLIILGIE
jgi:hypothetical protein